MLLTIAAVVAHATHGIPQTALPTFPACQAHHRVAISGTVTELIQSAVVVLRARVQLGDKSSVSVYRTSTWKHHLLLQHWMTGEKANRMLTLQRKLNFARGF